ncbi:MAG: 50S ribosomal protein L7/L12 [Clostridiales bacterium]|nr:50S ribosomal protein L7/L12 [Clostridiales bacterium]
MTHAEIIAAVEAMTVLELADLVKAMEEKFGVSAAATAVVAGPAAAAAPVEEKTEFDVILKGFDAAAKLKVLKVIREVCGLGLKEAKDFVEAAATGPKTVKEGLSKEDAEKLAAQIKEVGGEVEVK